MITYEPEYYWIRFEALGWVPAEKTDRGWYHVGSDVPTPIGDEDVLEVGPRIFLPSGETASTLPRLRTLAKAATLGPWFDQRTSKGVGVSSLSGHVCYTTTPAVKSGRMDDAANALYIAAANPETVLALIETIEKLAVGLLEIAELAMPDTFLQTDSRVALARQVKGEM